MLTLRSETLDIPGKKLKSNFTVCFPHSNRLIFYDAAGKAGGVVSRAFDHGKLPNIYADGSAR